MHAVGMQSIRYVLLDGVSTMTKFIGEFQFAFSDHVLV